MGKIKKKYESGAALRYISRTQALKKLQLSLKDFRRLCILKGIYPREPKNRKKVNKGNTNSKIWFYTKDIIFLQQEPILDKFRDYKVFVRKLRKALHKKEPEAANRLRNNKPSYHVDHIVLERYPSFVDALRDLDDALCLCFLFSKMPKSAVIKQEMVELCQRLTTEFMHYVIMSKSLRKVFMSIKGVYYEVEINGQAIVWIVPHERGQHPVSEVDFNVMATFLEFYTTMLGFVNYKLYSAFGLHYPPQLQVAQQPTCSALPEHDAEDFDILLSDLKMAQNKELISDEIDEFEKGDCGLDEYKRMLEDRAEVEALKNLFQSCCFCLNREVPVVSLTFVIRSCGGCVVHDETSDKEITHHVVDRPSLVKQELNRWYIQPQWVYDCVNAKRLLDLDQYFPGATLPPHLSPFVTEDRGTLVQREFLKEQIAPEPTESESKQNRKVMKQQENKSNERKLEVSVGKTNVKKIEEEKRQSASVRKLQEMMIEKRYRNAYRKMKFGQKRKNQAKLKRQTARNQS